LAGADPMMRRAFWLMVGVGFGFGMSLWSMRAIRRTLDRHVPPSLLERIGRVTAWLDGAVRAAGR
jgi:hypothetical protein